MRIGAGMAVVLAAALIGALGGSAWADGGPAPPGYMDGSFYGDGYWLLPYSAVTAIAPAAGDATVVAGWVSNGLNQNAYVVRLGADGAPDPAFGVNGIRQLDAGGTDSATGVAVQPDGEIVVVGTSDEKRALVYRLSASGAIEGATVVDGSVARAVALQADGKIVVAADRSDGSAVVYRLSNGELDPAFGDEGTAWLGDGVARAIAVQPDGKIVVAGASDTYGVVWRLNPDGTPDPSFGGAGSMWFRGGTTESEEALALADGKIVVASRLTDGAPPNAWSTVAGVRRLGSDGTLDLTFGFQGLVRLDAYSPGPLMSGHDDTAHAVAVQPDGRILVGGSGFLSGYRVVYRLDASGTLDDTFGAEAPLDPYKATSFGPEKRIGVVNALDLQPSGKIIAASAVTDYGDMGPGSDFHTAASVVFRLTGDPRTLTVTNPRPRLGTVSSEPAGLTCGDTCALPVEGGAVVTLDPSPARGSTFTGWSGGGCEGTGPCKVTLNSDTTVGASFEATAPVTITRHPGRRVAARAKRTAVTFRFRGGPRPTTFFCRLDGRAYRRCTSPATYAVGRGAHRFAVEGRTALGEGLATSFAFRVVAS